MVCKERTDCKVVVGTLRLNGEGATPPEPIVNLLKKYFTEVIIYALQTDWKDLLDIDRNDVLHPE